jgi:hypothetical protein
MTVSVATVQNITGGSSSIVAVDPPPEGRAGVQVKFTFAGNLPILQAFQMANAQGLPLTQVQSLAIDNTTNPYPISVTHGLFSETVTVGAFGFMIVPTFSNKGPYSINIAPITGNNATADGMSVSVLFLNYNRPSASFSGTNALNASAPQCTTTEWVPEGVSNLITNMTAIGQTVSVLPTFNPFYLYALEVNIVDAVATAALPFRVGLSIQFLGYNGNVAHVYVTGLGTGAGVLAPLNKTNFWDLSAAPIYVNAPQFNPLVAMVPADGLVNANSFHMTMNAFIGPAA